MRWGSWAVLVATIGGGCASSTVDPADDTDLADTGAADTDPVVADTDDEDDEDDTDADTDERLVDPNGDDDDTDVDRCDADDLVFRVEARDGDGPCTTDCDAADPLVLVGVVDNPCHHEVVLTTLSTCLVASWALANDLYVVDEDYAICGDALTDRHIPGYGRLEAVVDEQVRDWGTYTATIVFDDAGHHAPRAEITLVP